MDKIWDRNPWKLEVIGRCGGYEKTEWPRRTDNSRTLNPPTVPKKHTILIRIKAPSKMVFDGPFNLGSFSFMSKKVKVWTTNPYCNVSSKSTIVKCKTKHCYVCWIRIKRKKKQKRNKSTHNSNLLEKITFAWIEENLKMHLFLQKFIHHSVACNLKWKTENL